VDLTKKLPAEIENSFPDYALYPSKNCAIGFITRGCHKVCEFCLVPVKEGVVKQVASFEQFVPPGQRNVMLLDDNLLSYYDADTILKTIIQRGYAVNFSQSLDISYLSENNLELLKKVDSRNSKFTKRIVKVQAAISAWRKHGRHKRLAEAATYFNHIRKKRRFFDPLDISRPDWSRRG